MLVLAKVLIRGSHQIRILTISGSLRAGSKNTAVLEAVLYLAPFGTTISIFKEMGNLPHVNPDLEELLPDSVRFLREEIGRSDALLLSVPEYAHGIPGALKSLLDWLVGSLEFPDKTVGLINTSRRAHHAQDQLIEVLKTMNARLIADSPLALDLLGRDVDAADIASNTEMAAAIRALLENIRDVSAWTRKAL